MLRVIDLMIIILLVVILFQVYFAYAEDDVEIDSQLVEEAIKNYDNPIVKKYSGGHFFSSGIERKVAQEFIDSIKNNMNNKIPPPIVTLFFGKCIYLSDLAGLNLVT